MSRKDAKTQRKPKSALHLCAVARLLIFACAIAATASAQDQHVSWTLRAEPATTSAGGKVLLHMAGRIEEGWHLYSMSTSGAMPTRIQVAGPVVEKFRALQTQPKRSYDPNFQAETESYEGQVEFLLEVELKKDTPAGPAELAVSAKYQTCNPKMCVPSKWAGTATVTVDPAAAVTAAVIPAGYSEPAAPPPPGTEGGSSAQQESFAGFLAVAFGFGLAAIFTPCVFPM